MKKTKTIIVILLALVAISSTTSMYVFLHHPICAIFAFLFFLVLYPLSLIDINSWVEKKMAQVAAKDPDKILIENISNFFWIPNWLAKYLCEEAVREGMFERKYGVFKDYRGEKIITFYSLIDKK